MFSTKENIGSIKEKCQLVKRSAGTFVKLGGEAG